MSVEEIRAERALRQRDKPQHINSASEAYYAELERKEIEKAIRLSMQQVTGKGSSSTAQKNTPGHNGQGSTQQLSNQVLKNSGLSHSGAHGANPQSPPPSAFNKTPSYHKIPAPVQAPEEEYGSDKEYTGVEPLVWSALVFDDHH
jgi:hypothetical protein